MITVKQWTGSSGSGCSPALRHLCPHLLLPPHQLLLDVSRRSLFGPLFGQFFSLFGHYLATIFPLFCPLFGHYLVTSWPLCGCYLVTISLTFTGSFLKVIYVYCLKGYINCGTCSHPELTLDHVLTSTYVIIFWTVAINAVNRESGGKKCFWLPSIKIQIFPDPNA